MIKIILISFILIPLSELYSQDLNIKDVPEKVRAAFSTMHPYAVNVEWEKEKNNYEAEFRQSGLETSVIFDANGNHILTENEIAASSLPPAVTEYIRTNRPGSKIQDADKISFADGSVQYEVEIGNDEYYFDASGNFLKKETESSDDDSDDK